MNRTFALVLAVAAAGIVATTASTSPTERSGELHVTKECTQYDPMTAGSFCTITSSNINAIRKQMRVVYASAADLTAGVLDSDLVIDGPGRNDAFGHVVLDLQTLSGVVTLDGGTGRFTHFHAGPLTVVCPKFPELCSWDGPYAFLPSDHD
jgi:hypothetical protein